MNRWFALCILFGINAMNFYDRQILGAVMEPVRKAWGLSDSAMGWLSTAFTLFYAVVGVPLGIIGLFLSRGWEWEWGKRHVRLLLTRSSGIYIPRTNVAGRFRFSCWV